MIPLGEVPGTIRESLRASLSSSGLDLVRCAPQVPDAPAMLVRLDADAREDELAALSRAASQALYVAALSGAGGAPLLAMSPVLPVPAGPGAAPETHVRAVASALITRLLLEDGRGGDRQRGCGRRAVLQSLAIPTAIFASRVAEWHARIAAELARQRASIS